MSTVDSYSFIAAQTLGRDLIARGRGQLATWQPRHVQWSLLASAALAIGIALWKESAVSIWHDLGAIGTPMLLFPLILSFVKRWRVPQIAMVLAMLASGAGAAAWTFFGSYESGYPLGLDPIFIGLGLSAAFLLPALRNAKAS